MPFRSIRPLLVLTFVVAGAFADKSAFALDAALVERRVKDDVSYLASDALEGRGIDTQGIVKAADYIRAEFKRLGLKSAVKDGSYYQPFTARIDSKVNAEKTKLVLHGPAGKTIAMQLGKEYQALALGGAGDFNTPIIFAGYGITAEKLKYDDYKGIDVAGKVVLLLRREPQQGDEKSVFDGTRPSNHAPFVAKLQNAWAHKAAAVLLVNEPFNVKKPQDDTLLKPGDAGPDATVSIPFAQISQPIANQLLAGTAVKSLKEVETAIDKDLKPRSQPLAQWRAEGKLTFDRVEAKLNNVAAVIEGEGPLANETIIIGAHYDHLGYGGPGSLATGKDRAIHNGADDNASGAAALLELARRFAARPIKPARRIIFIAFSAEERGLLGSKHYTKKSPLVPLKDTVAMFNFDMVGRLQNEKLILYGTGTAKEFDALVDKAVKNHAFSLKKVPGGAGPSDHAAFYQENLPVFHYFTGTHSDYHKPSDKLDKINFAGIRRVADLAEEMLDSVLAMPCRPQFVKVKEENPHAGAAMGGGVRPYLGTVPDYTESADGALLSDVEKGSPADKAGLKAGDVIVEFAGIPVKNVTSFSAALFKQKPGAAVEITVQRGKEKKVLKATLGSRGKQ